MGQDLDNSPKRGRRRGGGGRGVGLFCISGFECDNKSVLHDTTDNTQIGGAQIEKVSFYTYLGQATANGKLNKE